MPCSFDILWLILDRANEDNDRKLADHVLAVHQQGAVPQPAPESAPLTPAQLRTYVAMAKQHAPNLPESLTDYVAAIYSELRRQEAIADRPNSYTTPRTLLSILRLSQALAKLRFDNSVRPTITAIPLSKRIGMLQMHNSTDAATALCMAHFVSIFLCDCVRCGKAPMMRRHAAGRARAGD